MPQTVASILVSALEQVGVKHIFGLIGDSLNPLADAVRRSDIEWIGVRHEEGAALAAAGQAKLKLNGPAVVDCVVAADDAQPSAYRPGDGRELRDGKDQGSPARSYGAMTADVTCGRTDQSAGQVDGIRWGICGCYLGYTHQGRFFTKRENMTINQIEIERFNIISSKPFEMVMAKLKAAVGQPDIVEFTKTIRGARTFAELERAVHRGLGGKGLMIFMELDEGEILRRETGLDTPKIVRLLIGNPLIMKEMIKHVPDAGSYAPVTVLVDERPDGVRVSYDKMASLLARYGNPDALAVARDLDSKIESLLRACTY